MEGKKPRGRLVCLKQGMSEGKSPGLRPEGEAKTRSGSLISHKKGGGTLSWGQGEAIESLAEQQPARFAFWKHHLDCSVGLDGRGYGRLNSSCVMGSECWVVVCSPEWGDKHYLGRMELVQWLTGWIGGEGGSEATRGQLV